MRKIFVQLDDDLLRRLGESSFLAGQIGGGKSVEAVFGFIINGEEERQVQRLVGREKGEEEGE